MNGAIVKRGHAGTGSWSSPDVIGGWGTILVIYGPPIAGAGIGAWLGGPKRRFMGGLIGLAVGVGVDAAYVAWVNAKNNALMKAPPVAVSNLKNPGYGYILVSTTGGDVVQQATATGFHVPGSEPHGAGPITAYWQGANGAPVPAGLKATQSAALAANQ